MCGFIYDAWADGVAREEPRKCGLSAAAVVVIVDAPISALVLLLLSCIDVAACAVVRSACFCRCRRSTLLLMIMLTFFAMRYLFKKQGVDLRSTFSVLRMRDYRFFTLTSMHAT